MLTHLNVLLQAPAAFSFHLFIAAEVFAQLSFADPKVGSGLYGLSDLQNSRHISGVVPITLCTLMEKLIHLIVFFLDFYQPGESFREARDAHSHVIEQGRNCKANKPWEFKL